MHMTSKPLESILKEALDRSLEQEAPQHHWKTERCLPIVRLVGMPRSRWSNEERSHVVGGLCRYCQRTIGLNWRNQCPGDIELLRYASSPESFPFRLAMTFHLEDDHCAECLDKLQMSWVWHLAARAKSARVALQHLADLVAVPVQMPAEAF